MNPSLVQALIPMIQSNFKPPYHWSPRIMNPPNIASSVIEDFTPDGTFAGLKKPPLMEVGGAMNK
jgi:hypothetical protein